MKDLRAKRQLEKKNDGNDRTYLTHDSAIVGNDWQRTTKQLGHNRYSNLSLFRSENDCLTFSSEKIDVQCSCLKLLLHQT